MAFRPLGQFPQFFLDNGQLNAGGSIATYENDLTTPKLTYSDEGLTVPNTNPLTLDASGRPTTDVWGDGIYGMEVADADDVVYLTANNIQADSGATQVIPTLAEGFLTNDLTNLLWQTILQVPDPSGFTDYILSNDGANPLWIPQPEIDIPEPDIVITTTPARSVRIGTSASTTKFFVLFGTGTAPATGDKDTSVNITWSTPFAQLWHVAVTTTISAATPSGALVDNSVTGFTPGSASSSVTVNFNVSDDDTNPAWKISNPIDFTYAAFGTIIVT
jgi:hypothetical protein